MTAATVRVMSPEEIAARAGGSTAYLRWPEGRSLFAERAMRLRQLAATHAMGDYLRFAAALALAQQVELDGHPAVALPDAAALDRAALAGHPPLSATDWPRDPHWQLIARRLAGALQTEVPEPARPRLQALAEADAVFLERQADALLHGLASGVDLAAAPLVAAALQVHWTQLLLATQAAHRAQGEPFARGDNPALCPGCGSRPVAAITRSGGESLGQRYLHCGLCNLEWHLPRNRCTHCGATQGISYQSLDLIAASEEESSQRAARAAVQAECCSACHHYLKQVHTDRDPFVDPVADDLASLSLDLLLAEQGMDRVGFNSLLLVGEPDPPDNPPDPGGP